MIATLVMTVTMRMKMRYHQLHHLLVVNIYDAIEQRNMTRTATPISKKSQYTKGTANIKLDGRVPSKITEEEDNEHVLGVIFQHHYIFKAGFNQLRGKLRS